jgi:hypothetical protein
VIDPCGHQKNRETPGLHGMHDTCPHGHMSAAHERGWGMRVSAIHCSHIVSDNESRLWARFGRLVFDADVDHCFVKTLILI